MPSPSLHSRINLPNSRFIGSTRFCALIAVACTTTSITSAFLPPVPTPTNFRAPPTTTTTTATAAAPQQHHSLAHLHSQSSTTTKLKMSNHPDEERPPKKGRNIIIIGGGIQGTSVAYHLHQSSSLPPHSTITILESTSLASAASGKGGGFMARSWGDGTVTQQLHELAFDMYEQMCDGGAGAGSSSSSSSSPSLGVTSYRKLPVLSVGPGPNINAKKKKSSSNNNNTNNNTNAAKEKNPSLANIIPNWLDGSVGRISPMGWGEDTAQVTPEEFVHKMMEFVNRPGSEGPGIEVVLGKCVGIDYSNDDENNGDGGDRIVKGVRYVPSSSNNDDGNDDDDTEEEKDKKEIILPADDVIVAAGPWACQAEQWFEGAVQLPMEGVKSTSIVWKPPVDEEGNAMVDAVDATALFCGEDHRFGTHLEVYPRPDGTIYICGIGGSDYITTPELQSSAYLGPSCLPKPDRVEAATSAFQLMSNKYAIEGELSHAQACMRPCPPDALPYMGRVPGYQGAYINAGHNCWGIAWAPACGKALAELVLDGDCRCLNLKPFDPARFTVGKGRGGRGRKKGNTDVGEQW